MQITRPVIDQFFQELTSLTDLNVLSPDGFRALADWCERQEFWRDFARKHRLVDGWRATPMGDPNAFALAVFRHQTRWGDW
ncbi:hypothetical protein GMST_04610 [Geomonas silvestris]|uniref:Uncharacterized protein n=1 Tax=Geomonas silvestris TaxID=2740184 RepID=A0A6V8MDR7_9BACT|nr:hypothetical protein [Geomonas silvestris]GFO58136.1 hypothetical protein GMST_04610 [Geomonas silvestris]